MIGDLSQLSDIVSRKKISDRRLRNEQIRQGFQDSGQFSLTNQQQIQQAQQPTEFWGAGRKEAKNQAADVEAANLVGGLHNLGGKHYYYGDKDTSTAQLGTKGFTLQDIGSGKYNLLDGAQNSIGTHYASPKEAVNSIWRARNPIDDKYYTATQRWDDWGGKSYFDEMGRTLTDVRNIGTEDTPIWEGKQIPKENPYRNTGGGALEDWENLGQILSGRTPMWTALKGGGVERMYSQDNLTQSISGLNTLYGSTPLIWDNKLLGYKMDLNPNNAAGDWGYKGDTPYLSRVDRSGKTQSASQIWRELQRPEDWAKYGTGLGGDQFLVKAEEAGNLPGWLNKEARDYHKQKSGGLLGGIFKFLDPILDKIDPLHNPTQDLISKPLGMTQEQAFSTIAPMVVNWFVPGLGSAISGVDAASRGDDRGMLASAISAAVGASGGLSNTGVAGTSLDLGSKAANAAANQFIMSTANNAIRGMPVGSALKSALFGAASQGAGGWLGDITTDQLGDVGSKILGGAASGGLNSLFNRDSPVKGSLFGGMSGGLHGYLNSVSKNSDTFNPAQDNKNKLAAENATKLAKLFNKRK